MTHENEKTGSERLEEEQKKVLQQLIAMQIWAKHPSWWPDLAPP
jgi:hypothetical protein